MKSAAVSTPLYQGTIEELNKLSRQELQELAQKHGVPASFKTATIIEKLMKQVTPKTEVITNQYQVDFTPLAPLHLSLKTPEPIPEAHNLEGKKITPPDLYAHIEQGCIPPTTGALLLSGNLLRDEGIPIVLSCFNFLALTVLDLEGNFITDAGVANLFSNLFNHPTLKKLSVAENLLYQCPMLAELLDHNHVLTHLNLSGNKIRDDTTIFVAPALKKNRGLVCLDVSDNELTQETLVVFCDVLEENQMLTSILMNGNFMNINTTYELHGNIAMRLEMNSENKFRWLREGRGEY